MGKYGSCLEKNKRKEVNYSPYCPFTHLPNIYCVPAVYMSDTLLRAQAIKDYWKGRDGVQRHFRGRTSKTHSAIFDVGEEGI